MNQPGEAASSHGYWGGFVWHGGELERRWIPPRPSDFPGDERAWFDCVMFGTTPDTPPSNDGYRAGGYSGHGLSANQRHRLKYPNERLSGFNFFLAWCIPLSIIGILFMKLTSSPTSANGGFAPIIVGVIPLVLALFMTFARRHPLIALGILAGLSYLSHESDKRQATRAAAEHEARVEALLGKIAQQTHQGPPDYTGPAGFGRY